MSTRAGFAVSNDVICRVASIPSMTGIRTSITTTSGLGEPQDQGVSLPAADCPLPLHDRVAIPGLR